MEAGRLQDTSLCKMCSNNRIEYGVIKQNTYISKFMPVPADVGLYY